LKTAFTAAMPSWDQDYYEGPLPIAGPFCESGVRNIPVAIITSFWIKNPL